MPPATTLRPIAVTASAESIPAFCMKRTLSAIPPTLAGVTRLTNDDAICVSTVGPNGIGCGVPPSSPTADATYVVIDRTAAASSHQRFAEPMASKLSSTLASCGSRT